MKYYRVCLEYVIFQFTHHTNLDYFSLNKSLSPRQGEKQYFRPDKTVDAREVGLKKNDS